ncbi:MAG: Thiamine pyrophosphokinase [Acetothermia bacterium 64_32]|nr:MAG: Thiamine pyrophosphokinase [Acetothermia bacterium 64_32]HAF69813.1 thiamine diphosphokinase [Candidatus Acetothermia bacterium]
MEGSVVIVAGGDLPCPEGLKAVAKRAGLVVAVDGGLSRARAVGIPVHVLVGDLDSLQETPLPPGLKVLKHPAEKDATDLELALDYAVGLSPRELHLFGALGKRLDHTLANLNLLERYQIPITIHHGRETLYAVSGELVLGAARVGDRVSLIPLSSSVTGVHTQGLRYPLTGGTLKRASSRGVSNEVTSLPCWIELEAGRLLVIHAQERRQA